MIVIIIFSEYMLFAPDKGTGFATRGQYQCEGGCPRKVSGSIPKVSDKAEGMAMKARAFVQLATNADESRGLVSLGSGEQPLGFIK
jgi:hypothetical protein